MDVSESAEAERRADHPRPADRPAVDELGQLPGLRVVAPHERLHQQAPGPVGRVEGGLDLRGAARHRLLAEHVLARLERADRPLAVERVREGDVDGLDVRVVEQRLVAAVRALDAPLPRVLLGAGGVAARDRDQVARVRALRGRDHEPVDMRRGDDSPADRLHRYDGSADGPEGGLEDAMGARPRQGEDDHLGHVLRAHHPGELRHLGRAPAPHGEVGGDPARADVRAADSPLAQLVVERARETDLRELRRAVDGLERQAAEACHGRDGDEVGLPALEQVRQRRARRVDRSLDVHVDHLVEVLRRELEERAVGADPGVGDEDVQASEPLDGVLHDAFEVGRVADVARTRDHVVESQVVAAA